jgi:hypothetical protein
MRPTFAGLHGAVALVISLSARPLGAQTQPTYPLACRGPFTVVVHPTMTSLRHQVGQSVLLFDFLLGKGSTAAGRAGDGLQSGTCGWVDRPLNGDEPRRLRVLADQAYYFSGASGYAVFPLLQPLLECMASAACVTVLPARSGWAQPAGDSVEVKAAPGTQAVLWGTPFAWPSHPPTYLYLIHLDGSSRPDLTALPTDVPGVEVRSAP